MQAKHQRSFREIVADVRQVRARSGYSFDPESDNWRLMGATLDFSTFDHVATPAFKAEMKEVFAKLIGSNQYADASMLQDFYALRDCIRSEKQPTNCLTDGLIHSWCQSPSGKNYPFNLKVFIKRNRDIDPQAHPGVSNDVLDRIQADVNENTILSLDPKSGPFLQAEVAAQDAAIQNAYVSGVWHPEKFSLVQLLRTYGMRVISLSSMKVCDVRHPVLGDEVEEVRWPFAKNEKPIEEAMWHPLPNLLSAALADYLKLRLDGVPSAEWAQLPLFTAEGLPNAFPTGFHGGQSKPYDQGYLAGHAKGAVLGRRYTAAMKTLNLKTHRSGKEAPMHFHPHRERHTAGMRLALKGFSAAHIMVYLVRPEQRLGL